MTALTELYAAILADPHDMSRRLAYADAVEATDPDHARLIRVQVEAEGVWTPQSGIPEELARRRPGLVLKLRKRLGAVVADLVDGSGLSGGFADVVRLSGAAFLERGEAVYGRVPVRHVILTKVDAGLLARIVASPLLDRLSSLSLERNRIGDEGVRALVASTHLRRLRWLSLEHCGIGAAGAEAFCAAAARSLPELRWLGFDGNSVHLVPYGEGYDVLNPDPGPMYITVPDFGAGMNERYGPFAWMDEALVRNPPTFGDV